MELSDIYENLESAINFKVIQIVFNSLPGCQINVFIQINLENRNAWFPSYLDYIAKNRTIYKFETEEKFQYDDSSVGIEPRYWEEYLEREKYLATLKRRHEDKQMMKLCLGPGKFQSCETQFHPVLTDSGICYAFNAFNLTTSISDNSYTSLFKKIYQPHHENTILKNGNGENALFMILDSQNSNLFNPGIGEFTIAINQATDYVSVLDNPIKAQIGHHTVIEVYQVEMSIILTRQLIKFDFL